MQLRNSNIEPGVENFEMEDEPRVCLAKRHVMNKNNLKFKVVKQKIKMISKTQKVEPLINL